MHMENLIGNNKLAFKMNYVETYLVGQVRSTTSDQNFKTLLAKFWLKIQLN